MKRNVRFPVQASLIAALYATLTIMQNILLPGSASAAVQFRVSEVLAVLALYTPAAIPGLFLGCIIANISSLAVLGPFDMIFGSAASLLAVQPCEAGLPKRLYWLTDNESGLPFSWYQHEWNR